MLLYNLSTYLSITSQCSTSVHKLGGPAVQTVHWLYTYCYNECTQVRWSCCADCALALHILLQLILACASTLWDFSCSEDLLLLDLAFVQISLYVVRISRLGTRHGDSEVAGNDAT